MSSNYIKQIQDGEELLEKIKERIEVLSNQDLRNQLKISEIEERRYKMSKKKKLSNYNKSRLKLNKKMENILTPRISRRTRNIEEQKNNLRKVRATINSLKLKLIEHPSTAPNRRNPPNNSVQGGGVIHIKGLGKRKIHKYKNGNKYVIIKGVKKSLKSLKKN